MNSNNELEQVKERVERLEQKLDLLAGSLQGDRRSPAARFLIGFGVVLAVLFILMICIGVVQFVSNGS
ncbi:OadG family protein [Paenibacillus sp. MABNR03]|uniref:OadG family protein n=1 Tax=Paenibacillus sp. MABNR03 TaxID=3142626 RepID=UPI003D28186D